MRLLLPVFVLFRPMLECGKSPHSPWGSWGSMLPPPPTPSFFPSYCHPPSIAHTSTRTCIPLAARRGRGSQASKARVIGGVESPNPSPYLDARIFAALSRNLPPSPLPPLPSPCPSHLPGAHFPAHTHQSSPITHHHTALHTYTCRRRQSARVARGNKLLPSRHLFVLARLRRPRSGHTIDHLTRPSCPPLLSINYQ